MVFVEKEGKLDFINNAVVSANTMDESVGRSAFQYKVFFLKKKRAKLNFN